jgi:DNA-binding MarR family transcriptional regulator
VLSAGVVLEGDGVGGLLDPAGDQAPAIVHAFQEEFTAPIGGTKSQRTRDLARTLRTLLGTQDRSDPMAPPATLTGQDVGEAEGALTALLNQVLTSTNTGITRAQYLALRILALRGPAPAPAGLHDDLAAQPQLGLDRPQIAELFRDLEARGLVTGSAPDGPGPTQLTPDGAALNASLADAVAVLTQPLYADLDPDDLATAHRILVEVTQRARRLRAQP